MARPLNPRQLRFVEHYLADPNATQAAKKAGYRGSDETLATTGARMLRNAKVAALLKGRQQNESDKRLADADEIRRFWAEVMRDKKVDQRDRLKASELLGKTKGMFVDKTEHQGRVEVVVRRGNDAAGALAPKEDEDG